jgi:hypothetical protein
MSACSDDCHDDACKPGYAGCASTLSFIINWYASLSLSSSLPQLKSKEKQIATLGLGFCKIARIVAHRW